MPVERADVEALVKDADFAKLPTLEQHEVLRQYLAGRDEAIAKLPVTEQTELVRQFLATQPTTAMTLTAPAPKSFARTAAETVVENLPAVGAVAGGAAGAAVGALPGGVAGAGLGAAGGSALRNVGRQLLGTDPGTMWQQLATNIREGVLGATFEAGGQVAMRAAGAVLQPVGRAIRRTLLPAGVTPEAQTARTALAQKGVSLTPGQLGGEEATALNMLENVASNALMGQRRFAHMRLGQQQATEAIADDIVTDLGSKIGDTKLGQVLVGLVNGEMNFFRAAANAAYRHVDDLAQGATVHTDALANFLRFEGMRLNVKQTIGAAFPEGAKKFTSAQVAGQNRRVNEIPFWLAQETRSRLLQVSRTKTDIAVARTAKHMAGLVDEAIESSSVGLTAEAKDAFRAANEFYKEGQERLNNALIRKLVRVMEQEPGRLSSILLAKDRVNLLQRVRGALGDEVYREVIQPKLASSLLHRAIDPQTGRVSGEALLTSIKGLGDETVNAALAPGTAVAIRDLATTLRVVERRAGGTGTVWIQLAQASAIGGLTGLSGKPTRAGAAILLGPAVLSRVLTNPENIRRLTAGIRAGPKSELLVRAVSQFGGHLLVDGREVAMPEGSHAPTVAPPVRSIVPPSGIPRD